MNSDTLILTQVVGQSFLGKVLTFSEGKLTQPDESASDSQIKHFRMETSGLTLMLKIIARLASCCRHDRPLSSHFMFLVFFMCAVDANRGLSAGISCLRRYKA